VSRARYFVKAAPWSFLIREARRTRPLVDLRPVTSEVSGSNFTLDFNDLRVPSGGQTVERLPVRQSISSQNLIHSKAFVTWSFYGKYTNGTQDVHGFAPSMPSEVPAYALA
jgi:hypothetical protein